MCIKSFINISIEKFINYILLLFIMEKVTANIHKVPTMVLLKELSDKCYKNNIPHDYNSIIYKGLQLYKKELGDFKNGSNTNNSSE